MRSVTYSMSMTADGFVVDSDGRFDWGAPDEEVFRDHLDELRGVGVHLLGRRLYETMLYWETAAETQDLSDDEREWASLWKQVPKVVFSTTLSSVEGTNTRLATATLADEVERLRSGPGEGGIAVGGATLAHQAAALDLVDVYRTHVYPVLVGGGLPYFPPGDRRADLELVSSRAFPSQVLALRYRVVR